jgi:hypothetical protein
MGQPGDGLQKVRLAGAVSADERGQAPQTFQHDILAGSVVLDVEAPEHDHSPLQWRHMSPFTLPDKPGTANRRMLADAARHH